MRNKHINSSSQEFLPKEKTYQKYNQLIVQKKKKNALRNYVHCAQSLSPVTTLQPHGLQPARLLCPWGSPGKNTGVGCRALLQGIFPIQGLNEPRSPHCRQITYRLSHQGSPGGIIVRNYFNILHF